MTLTPHVAALALVAALTTGCSADSGPGLQPADPSDTDSSATRPASAPPEELGDPLSFSSSRQHVVIRCFPDDVRRMVFFDTVRTDREVTLTGVRTDGTALRITDAFVTELPHRAVGESGVLDLGARGIMVDDIRGWADREPLEDAALVPGPDYTFLVVARVLPDRTLDDLVFRWDDGTAAGRSPYAQQGRTRSGGC